MSIVRDNLMERPGYTPYCGNASCHFRMPRTHFDGKQFACACGWHSTFEPEFIAQYAAKWSIASAQHEGHGETETGI